ncbi:MAG: hypothetical protein LPK47_07560 [Bacteroidota bacterium]|nr:hypothetical protein [Bacteroidota bacterium]
MNDATNLSMDLKVLDLEKGKNEREEMTRGSSKILRTNGGYPKNHYIL